MLGIKQLVLAMNTKRRDILTVPKLSFTLSVFTATVQVFEMPVFLWQIFGKPLPQAFEVRPLNTP